MSVVNCKVEFIRKDGYKDLKDWCSDTNNVYVARAGVVFVKEGDKKERFPKKDSVFCNPFKVGKDGTREEVIAKFRSSMDAKLRADPLLVEELRKMKGKRLGCWCKPEACHGDVLLELMSRY